MGRRHHDRSHLEATMPRCAGPTHGHVDYTFAARTPDHTHPLPPPCHGHQHLWPTGDANPLGHRKRPPQLPVSGEAAFREPITVAASCVTNLRARVMS